MNDEQPGARRASDGSESANGRARSRVTSWVTIYDGPRRTVTITAAQSPGHHCALLARTNPVDDGFALWCNDDGDVVAIELSLDDRGGPIAAPEGMNGDLLGSMTLWPRADMHYLWWNQDTELFPDGGLSLQDAIEPLRP